MAKNTTKSSKNSHGDSPKRTGARSNVTGRFVISKKRDGWAVTREGAKQTRVYDTQAAAVKAASKSARTTRSDVIIRRKDGTIKDRVSTSRADSRMLDVWGATHKAHTSSKKR